MSKVEVAPVEEQRVVRLRKLDCCAVSDALDRLQLRGVVSGLPQRSGSGRIAGRVITVKLGIGDPPPGPPRHLCTTAVEAGGPYHVIAVEQRTGIEAGSWGGLLSLGAKLKGIAGVVVDGPLRDVDEARQYEFPIFSRSLTALTARGRVVEKATNVPIRIGEIDVHPGDYVVADGSAVAFIPAAQIDAVLHAAESIAAREAAMAQALRAGTPISQVMAGNYEQMLKKDNETGGDKR
jgi:4-hydroxy-4-methyl-2-oxoglutarate aldolase